MGCDIHFYVEVKNADGKWEYVEGPKREWDKEGAYEGAFYSGRNYSLFGILAGVRANDFPPIDEPRGIPSDMSDGVAKFFKLRVVSDEEYKRIADEGTEEEETFSCSLTNAQRWNPKFNIKVGDMIRHPDWHTPSYFTLAELLAFDWEKTITRRGLVNAEEFKRYKAQGAPDYWYEKSFHAPRATVISPAKMEKVIAEGTTTPDGRIFLAEIKWEAKYADSAGNFLTKTIPALQKLGTPENVRCVFWFDN